TTFMQSEGYGKGYVYDHDTPHGFSGQDYFPDTLPRLTFYDPKEVGFERELRKRMDYWKNLREKLRKL
ncbi:MAG: replication-associated recombination protein A, partial [Candidatus Nucleicultricaceae bacterium]